ncbi:MAG: hypothetical protein GXY92_00900 [Syntrophomonadaceae bacterium]|nr:hypothetical protein [Syntrophomonadaceae bacterium]
MALTLRHCRDRQGNEPLSVKAETRAATGIVQMIAAVQPDAADRSGAGD